MLDAAYRVGGCLAVALLLSNCAEGPTASPSPATAMKEPAAKKTPAPPKKVGVSFTKEVKPILENKCAICHNRATLPGRPSFENRELAMITGSRGPVISPGNPDESGLLRRVREVPESEEAMPPVGHRLTAGEIATLRKWISEGAEWPSGRAGKVTPAFIPTE